MAQCLKRMVLAMAACAALGACSDDPRRGGFVSGAYNLATGGYEQRIAREQATLDEETARQSALQGRADQLRRQRQELNQNLGQLRRDVSVLDMRLRVLRAEIARSNDANQRARLEEAALRLATAQKKLESTAWQDQPADEALQLLRELKSETTDIAAVADAAR